MTPPLAATSASAPVSALNISRTLIVIAESVFYLAYSTTRRPRDRRPLLVVLVQLVLQLVRSMWGSVFTASRGAYVCIRGKVPATTFPLFSTVRPYRLAAVLVSVPVYVNMLCAPAVRVWILLLIELVFTVLFALAAVRLLFAPYSARSACLRTMTLSGCGYVSAVYAFRRASASRSTVAAARSGNVRSNPVWHRNRRAWIPGHAG